MSLTVQPAAVHVPEEQLEDLRGRLRRTRWPEPATVPGWSQGAPLEVVRDLCAHWAEGYDWRRGEAALNAHDPVRVEVDGVGIHVLHARSRHVGAVPLVLTHGWPGSVVEFLEVIGPLTDPPDPTDAFHVICPTLPGYGWSDKPAAPGWGTERVADAWVEMMAALGYERFAAQGGDWGAGVTTALARRHPDRLVGIHLNFVPVGPPPDRSEPWAEDELAALAAARHYADVESGYSKEQSTRPQTVGYSLVDSPAGLCAWILEKFWAWTDTAGDPVGALGADRILDDVMTYWLPATGASAARLYWESFGKRSTEPVTVPTGVTVFPKELFRPPRAWVESVYTDLRTWSTPPQGGHFAALEQPARLVDDVRALFRGLR